MVIISDLFDELDAITSGLEHLRYKHHEVLLVHILDPWERDLPLEENVPFHDLEKVGARSESAMTGVLKGGKMGKGENGKWTSSFLLLGALQILYGFSAMHATYSWLTS